MPELLKTVRGQVRATTAEELSVRMSFRAWLTLTDWTPRRS